MRSFKVSGILYSNGELIGTSTVRIATDDLEDLVKRSPERIPVVNSFNCNWHDPENVIGHAELEYVTNKGNLHIDAHVTLNAHNADIYEELLNRDPKAVRLGFLIHAYNRDNDIIRGGTIRLVLLSTDALGGYLYKFGWEDSSVT
jgi:hypothetical protein